ncbi:hypothetical protein Q5P01_010376 [Channa striata]|uniref:Receptor ligand binding region domain-containing protein n=1 Tax=Channa striata TaxID=64152 RepID=A0AA88SYA9_CHASR|nr:hypothetical protein Q5P01_010376 [Channa striata]
MGAFFYICFHVCLHLFLFLFSDSSSVSSPCKLWRQFHLNGLHKAGDVNLGGLFEVHYTSVFPEWTFTSEPRQPTCTGFDTQGFRHAMMMVFAVEEINTNFNLLPNITLGYSLYDNCGALVIGFRAALVLASGQEQQFLFQENCLGNPPVLGIVGDSYSTFSIASSNVLGLFRLPMLQRRFMLNGMHKPGDVILGGLFEVHYTSVFPELTFTTKPNQPSCQGFDPPGFRHAMTMAFAIDEINKNSNLLPNLTLGYSLYDNCATLVIGFSAALSLASGREEQFLAQENCVGSPPVLGIVGELLCHMLVSE